MARDKLLLIDGLINLILGGLLLVFPRTIVKSLGLLDTEQAFYPSVLGAVLLGIGLALLLERYRGKRHWRGLGLGGAVVINLCGGLALAYWLLSGGIRIPLQGAILLWLLVIVLIGISAFELATSLQVQGGRAGD